MKLRLLVIPLTLAATVFLATACGGDDNTMSSATPTNGSSSSTDQTLKEYFRRLSDILTGVDNQSNQLNTKYPSAGNDPDQTRQYIAEFLPAIANALNDIKNLDVPGTAKDQHDKLVSAIEGLLAADTSVSNDIQGVNSASDLKVYFDSHKSDLSAKYDRVNADCADLQKVANNNSVAIDLKCSGPSSTTASTPGPAPGFQKTGLRVEAVDFDLGRLDFALIGPYSGPLPRDVKIADDLEGVCQVLRVTDPAGETAVNLSADEKLVFTVEYACEKGRAVKLVGLFGIIFERPYQTPGSTEFTPLTPGTEVGFQTRVEVSPTASTR